MSTTTWDTDPVTIDSIRRLQYELETLADPDPDPVASAGAAFVA